MDVYLTPSYWPQYGGLAVAISITVQPRLQTSTETLEPPASFTTWYNIYNIGEERF